MYTLTIMIINRTARIALIGVFSIAMCVVQADNVDPAEKYRKACPGPWPGSVHNASGAVILLVNGFFENASASRVRSDVVKKPIGPAIECGHTPISHRD